MLSFGALMASLLLEEKYLFKVQPKQSQCYAAVLLINMDMFWEHSQAKLFLLKVEC